MKILITGGLGFLGRFLSQVLLDAGHHVTAVGLSPNPALIPHDNFSYIAADTSQEGNWQESLQTIDAVINLAGVSIFKRWNQKYKDLIYNSRILTTRNLVDALPDESAVTLLSTSAVGYYGDRGDEVLTEASSTGHDFLSALARDWEAEAYKAASKGARVVIMRFGIVLGKGGGALASMLPPFKMFAGGPLGNGKHWFPWIHIGDLARAAGFLLENDNLQGPFNCCAPQPVRNSEFTTALGKVLNRPAILPTPGVVLRFFLGELAEVLLASSRAFPDKLQKNGFTFTFPDIESALLDLINN